MAKEDFLSNLYILFYQLRRELWSLSRQWSRQTLGTLTPWATVPSPSSGRSGNITVTFIRQGHITCQLHQAGQATILSTLSVRSGNNTFTFRQIQRQQYCQQAGQPTTTSHSSEMSKQSKVTTKSDKLPTSSGRSGNNTVNFIRQVSQQLRHVHQECQNNPR